MDVICTIADDHALILEEKRGTTVATHQRSFKRSNEPEAENFMSTNLAKTELGGVERKSLLHPRHEKEPKKDIRLEVAEPRSAGIGPKQMVCTNGTGSRNKTSLRNRKVRRGPLVLLDGRWINQTPTPLNSVYSCGTLRVTETNRERPNAEYSHTHCAHDNTECFSPILKKLHPDIKGDANEENLCSTLQKGFFPDSLLRSVAPTEDRDLDGGAFAHRDATEVSSRSASRSLGARNPPFYCCASVRGVGIQTPCEPWGVYTLHVSLLSTPLQTLWQ